MKTKLVMLVFVLITSACSSKNTYTVIEDQNGNDRSFDGIVDIINQEGNTNVLFIHGMSGYAKLDDEKPIDPCTVINSVRANFGLSAGDFQYPDLHCSDTFNVDDKTVHLMSMHWSDVTSFQKIQLNAIDQQSSFDEKRLDITKQAKYGLVNDGFADALMYTGSYKDLVLKRIIDQYKRVQETNPADKVIIVTFSLGSSIFIDSLERLNQSGEQDLLKGKIRMVYMMANQVPLIDLATSDVTNKPSAISQTYETISPYLSDSIDKSNDKVRFVAFSDPNDLLSYPLDSERMGNLKGDYVNVAAPAADKTYYVPFFKKFSIVNYKNAHLAYVYSEPIMKLLLDGYKKEE